MRITGAYIPVDETYIIPGTVFSHFPEAHTTTFKGRMVLTRKHLGRKNLALNFEIFYLLEYISSCKPDIILYRRSCCRGFYVLFLLKQGLYYTIKASYIS